jgi:hypothetical protein
MYLPSSLCRAQEAHHRERADGALLDNLRRIAASAAAAWRKEAESAERREARHAGANVPIGVARAMELPARPRAVRAP